MPVNGIVHELLPWPTKGCALPVEVERAEAVPGTGLRGDQRRGHTRQVTLLAAEAWEAATTELGVTAPPSARRANVVGRRLRVGPVLIQVNGETDPCEMMERVAPGLKAALTPDRRAGVFGAVIEGGAIAVGDPVCVE